MGTSAFFPKARRAAGMYESFYLRAVDPDAPRGVWIRNTVHKRRGASATGSVWCTLFDTSAEHPFMHKLSGEPPAVPRGGWISIGERSSMGPGCAEGSCGPARWSLRYESEEAELRHLEPALLYRAPLPRTKLTSPAPAARFSGTFAVEGAGAIELSQWPGMVGHNWGSEHAERWIWLHCAGFEEAPAAWLDVALGRVRVAGRLTPWVANGALSLDGVRHRVGGISARGLSVAERASGCELSVPSSGGQMLSVRAGVPRGSAAGWRYADPDGGEHDVLNCSIASLEIELAGGPGAGGRMLSSPHGAAYELGMREHDDGVTLAPFADG